jgi:predicted amidohydrolase
MRVAAAQMKFRPSVSENVDWIVSAIGKAAGKVDAILFPECSTTGYNCDFNAISESTIERAIAEVRKAARSAGCNVLLGSPTFRHGKRFNSLLVFDRKGREVFRYSKIHLTARDARFFSPGNSIAFFRLDRVPVTAIICHERRFPELVRLPVMMGAQILFHANAGLDSREVSKAKRHGRDGIVTRAFENQIFYVFSNSVGAQGDGLWSAGDSKIVGPDGRCIALANNKDEIVIDAELDLTQARRKYAVEALTAPTFLRKHWNSMLAACRKQLAKKGRA